ncbi:hypothetical protein C2E23DRAFT_881080 [Lenzites betulinus]|nr:hypothetical protein C2E23DRAFT_881080 [Lenzites betulinus]
MLLSYIILALSASFAPLASGRPAELSDAARASPMGGVEPGTLLGRPYSVQERRQLLSPSLSDAPTTEPYSSNAPRRLVPYAKFLADRSDDTWLRVRERRADDGNVNYLSNVGTYSVPKPYAPPSPPPVPSPPPAPSVPPPNVAIPPRPQVAAKTKASKDAQKKHTSKAKATKEKEHKSVQAAKAD